MKRFILFLALAATTACAHTYPVTLDDGVTVVTLNRDTPADRAPYAVAVALHNLPRAIGYTDPTTGSVVPGPVALAWAGVCVHIDATDHTRGQACAAEQRKLTPDIISADMSLVAAFNAYLDNRNDQNWADVVAHAASLGNALNNFQATAKMYGWKPDAQFNALVAALAAVVPVIIQ